MIATMMLVPAVYNYIIAEPHRRYCKSVGGDRLNVALANDIGADPGLVQVVLELLHNEGIIRLQEFTAEWLRPLTDDAGEDPDFERDSIDVSALQTELARLRAERTSLLQKIDSLTNANRRLEEEVKTYEQLSQEAAQKEARAAVALASVDALKREIDELLLEIEAQEHLSAALLQTSNDDLIAVQAELEIARRELDVSRRELDIERDRVGDKANQVRDLASQAQQQQTQITSLTQAHRAAMLALEEANRTLGAIQGGKVLKRVTLKHCSHAVVIIVDVGHDATAHNKCCWIEIDEARTPHPRQRNRPAAQPE
jgi:hypothetical protein